MSEVTELPSRELTLIVGAVLSTFGILELYRSYAQIKSENGLTLGQVLEEIFQFTSPFLYPQGRASFFRALSFLSLGLVVLTYGMFVYK